MEQNNIFSVTATPETISGSPRIVHSTRVDADALSSNIILDRVIATTGNVKDPVVELFISVRNKYKKRFHITILPARRTDAGWQYTMLPSNVADGDKDVASKFIEYLEWYIAPEFEARLELFFDSENGYFKYSEHIKNEEFDEANRVVDDFVYMLSSESERAHIDSKKAKEAARKMSPPTKEEIQEILSHSSKKRKSKK